MHVDRPILRLACSFVPHVLLRFVLARLPIVTPALRRRTSHSMIFGYHAQIGVIRTFIGWERGFWHLFAREFCPGSDSNVKRDLRESFAKREKSWHQSATRNTTRALQNAGWLDQHWFATLRLGHNPLLGHLILFLSRLNFRFAAAVFSQSTWCVSMN